jgi:hypothetical protein
MAAPTTAATNGNMDTEPIFPYDAGDDFDVADYDNDDLDKDGGNDEGIG